MIAQVGHRDHLSAGPTRPEKRLDAGSAGRRTYLDQEARTDGNEATDHDQDQDQDQDQDVDFAGQRPKIVDPKTGEVIEVELFVAVLGASSYTYAEATASQQGPQWIRAHTNALEYFGGSPRVYVPDTSRAR